MTVKYKRPSATGRAGETILAGLRDLRSILVAHTTHPGESWTVRLLGDFLEGYDYPGAVAIELTREQAQGLVNQLGAHGIIAEPWTVIAAQARARRTP